MSGTVHVAERDKRSQIGRQMSRWVDQVLGGFQHNYCRSDSWKPAINICEYAGHYCVIVDLAGVDASEIDLQASVDGLVIKGQRQMPVDLEPSGQARLHLMEIDHGRFQRRIELPAGVDIDGIEASYRGGFLWIHIPKRTGD